MKMMYKFEEKKLEAEILNKFEGEELEDTFEEEENKFEDDKMEMKMRSWSIKVANSFTDMRKQTNLSNWARVALKLITCPIEQVRQALQKFHASFLYKLTRD